MSKMIQIRNVPDDVHAELKARAARAGMSLSDLLLREASRLAQRATPEELIERARARTVSLDAPSSTQLIRDQRGDLRDVEAARSSAEAVRRQRGDA